MTPPLRRAVVNELMEQNGFSERHACDVTGFARSSQRYQARRRSYAELSTRLAALAGDRPRFGYRRLHILLDREGFKANHKLVYRLYRLAGLKLRGKRSKRRCGERRGKPLPPIAINDRWSMDFVSDRLVDGRAFRAFAVVDDVSKRCVVIEVDTSLPGLRVTRALEKAIDCYGKPNRLVMDNGPEFTNRAFLAWVQGRGIEPCWIDPGKPIQNACAESFDSRFRDEFLNQHVFTTLADARARIEGWRVDDDSLRPPTSLGGLAPDDFSASQAGGVPPSSEALMCSSPEKQQISKTRRLT